jgi:hypothetical protein
MLKKCAVLLAAVVGLCLSWGTTVLRADEGAAVIQPHLLPVYSPADSTNPPERTPLISKDPVAKIKKFYESKLQAGDRIEAFENENERGFRLTFYQTIDGKPQSVQLLEVTERIPGTILHDALGELKGLAMKGMHTEAEYQEMEKQYKNLTAAYYRQVDDGEGGTVSEGNRIYRLALNKARGDEKFEVDEAEVAEGKKKAKNLQKQMKALKAKGDFAGMMQMAQRNAMSPTDTKAGAAAMKAMAKDTWDIWAACLKDLKAAAYWTRLEFHYGALPAGE